MPPSSRAERTTSSAPSEPPRPEGWFAYCCAYVVDPDDRPISRQTLAHYRRISELPRKMGEDLDRLGTPLYMMRWIAWGVSRGAYVRRQRFKAAVAYYRRAHRWPPTAMLGPVSLLQKPGD